MKRAAFILCLFMILGAFVYRSDFRSGIQGIIDPADGARKVWAISGNDTASAIPAFGKFVIEVKPGNWRLYVEAVPPYKDTVVDNILVQDGQYTDVGVIQLIQR